MRLKSLSIFSILLAASLLASGIPAKAESMQDSLPLGVDIRDINHFNKGKSPEIRNLLFDMIKNASRYFPEGVAFNGKGAVYPWKSQVNIVYGVELAKMPRKFKDHYVMQFHAFVQAYNKGYFIRTLLVDFNSESEVNSVIVENDIDIGQLNMEAQINLTDRLIILQDKHLGITKIYPVDVGGFDEGVTPGSRRKTRLRTPVLNDPSLPKSLLIAARAEPEYYQNRPFLRFSSQGRATALGLHIEQGAGLTRGFMSHGCVRMREKDLYEIATLLRFGTPNAIPVEMSLLPQTTFEHPFPRNNTHYMTVQNFGTKEAPWAKRDKDGLTQMIHVEAEPPVNALTVIDTPLPLN